MHWYFKFAEEERSHKMKLLEYNLKRVAKNKNDIHFFALNP
jgi:ferritin